MIFLIFLLVSQDVLAKEDSGLLSNLRIVGGRTADIEEFPFMVFLSGPHHDYGKVRQCGGSILNKKWAITAAHCYEDVIVEEMCFLAGTSSTNTGGSYHCTKKFYPHEKYSLIYVPVKNVHTAQNDIAVVEVRTHFQLDGVKVAAVPLPLDDLYPPPGTNAIVVGWGRQEGNTTAYGKSPVKLHGAPVHSLDVGRGTYMSALCDRNLFSIYMATKAEETGASSDELHMAEIFIISRQECQWWYPYYYVSDQHICARHPDQWRGFCRGDSGGPILVGGFLMGISSWTDRNCGDPTKPNVFTFVPHYRDWIYKKTGL